MQESVDLVFNFSNWVVLQMKIYMYILWWKSILISMFEGMREVITTQENSETLKWLLWIS